MQRKWWIALLLVIVLSAAWIFFLTGTPPWGARIALKDAPVTSIELRWGGATQAISSSNECAQVIQTLRKARRSRTTATPLLGILTLYYGDGITNRFFLSPSHRFLAMQIADESGGYVISMDEMMRSFEDVGLLPRK